MEPETEAPLGQTVPPPSVMHLDLEPELTSGPSSDVPSPPGDGAPSLLALSSDDTGAEQQGARRYGAQTSSETDQTDLSTPPVPANLVQVDSMTMPMPLENEESFRRVEEHVPVPAMAPDEPPRTSSGYDSEGEDGDLDLAEAKRGASRPRPQSGASTIDDFDHAVRRIKVLCCSANIGNAPPDDLSKWLPADAHGADIVAIGVQEATWGAAAAKSEEKRRRAASDLTGQEEAKYSRNRKYTMDEYDDDDEDEDDEDDEAYLAPEAAPEFIKSSSELAGDFGGENAAGQEIPEINTADTISRRFIAHLNATKATENTRLVSRKGLDLSCTGIGAKTIKRFQYASGYPYVLLAARRAGQMRLYLFAKPAVVEMAREIETHSENTGLAHLAANKGGQLIKLRIRGTTLCFVSSHLRAHEGTNHAKGRNDNVVEILNGARVGQSSLDATNQFSHVFWMGDLNYRVALALKTGKVAEYIDSFMTKSLRQLHDGEEGAQNQGEKSNGAEKSNDDGDVTEERNSDSSKPGKDKKEKKREWKAFKAEVHRLVEEGDFASIYAMDELQHFIKNNVIFCGFETPVPSFKPTFKVKRAEGTQYNEKRIPSYTDRILYKSLPGLEKNLRLLNFESHETFASSDHKPISALFEMDTIKAPRLHKAKRHLANMAIVAFSDLKCRDLPVMDLEVAGGLADPYIKFYSNPPSLLRMHRRNALSRMSTHKRPRTSTQMRTLTPDWEDTRLKLNIDYGDSLEGCHIMLHVMDYDLSVLNPDDPIGTAVIPLKEVAESDGPYAFDLPLLWNSEYRGHISGSVLLSHHATSGHYHAGSVYNQRLNHEERPNRHTAKRVCEDRGALSDEEAEEAFQLPDDQDDKGCVIA
uniref:C2 domain-containing protein n=1 Tax=Phaeomonas parva TaxID=124430 RepID=A0A7S1UE04_9STRA|mmetsp:Transcript_43903/g.137976  ORF Transcript_43903/g.137976 Transcript_43903/m.137976 type:complete len:869 (+) Transcript_43903:406-3012(+)